MARQGSYLLVLSLVVLLPAVALWAYTYRLDPFAVYAAHSRDDVLQSEDLFWNLRLYKARRMEQQAAQHIVMGSSRSGRLAPRYLHHSDTVYNAAVPGATLYEILRHVEHAHSQQPLKSVLIGLDYYMFRDDKERSLPGFADARLRRLDAGWLDTARYHWQRFTDNWATLFSRSALVAAWRKQELGAHGLRSFYADGTWRVQPGERAGNWVYAALSKQKFEEYLQLSRQRDYSLFEQLLAFCRQQDIELTVLISPLHAHQMAVIDLVGAWPDYLAYQREVLTAVERSRQQGGRARLLGLEHSDTLLYEPISPDYHWFLDGIHYTREAGVEIMRCYASQFGAGEAAADCRQDFLPLVLSGDNIEAYLDTVSGNMRRYAGMRPKDYARLQRQLGKVQQQIAARP